MIDQPSEPMDLTSTKDRKRRRITATEVINGVEHLLVLEPDRFGRYREVSVTPLSNGGRALAAAQP